MPNCVLRTKGVGSGQHWLWGLGADTPASSICPRLLTVSAARGFKVGLASSPTTAPKASTVPSARRNLLTTAPGPDAGCSILSVLRPHMPEKSGIVAGLSAAAIVGEKKFDE